MVHRFQLATFLVTCATRWEKRAISELKRALPQSTCRPLFMPGTLLFNTETPRDKALAILDELETTVIGRIVPLDLRVDITRGPECFDTILEATNQLAPVQPGGSFKVVCHRRGEQDFDSRELEHYVGDGLADRWGLQADLDLPDQFVSIEIFQNLAFVSVCWPEELLRKTMVQMQRRGPQPINRAELKLREAIDQFKLQLPPSARALDLGAAPGGWSHVLAETCREVVAVDPAELDPRVTELPVVKHERRRAEDYLSEATEPFDLVVCDMNIEPTAAAALMNQAASLLPTGAVALMTIKFQTRQRRRHVEETLALLQGTYTDFELRHLPHNGKETTLCMRRAAS